jgi:hypothetical protein
LGKDRLDERSANDVKVVVEATDELSEEKRCG